MTLSTIDLTRQGSIALLVLNRPDKLNPIDATMIAEIDINPIIANASDAVAVDALIALKPQQSRC